MIRNLELRILEARMAQKFRTYNLEILTGQSRSQQIQSGCGFPCEINKPSANVCGHSANVFVGHSVGNLNSPVCACVARQAGRLCHELELES